MAQSTIMEFSVSTICEKLGRKSGLACQQDVINSTKTGGVSGGDGRTVVVIANCSDECVKVVKLWEEFLSGYDLPQN